MQDWDSRIKILKTNIQNAREKFVIPHLQVKEKSVPIPKEPSKILETIVGNEKKEDNTDENKIYENKDPLSSLELLNNEENMASDKSKTEPKLGLTEEITNKIDITLEKESKLEISAEAPKEDFTEVMETAEAPKVDVTEVMETAEVPKVDVTEVMETAEVPKVDVTEVMETAEAPKVDVTEVMETGEALKEETKIQISADENIENLDEEGVTKTELELLEEKNENDLTEDEEDRMYELRRLRAQKAMNKEAYEAVETDLKKADEEIAHLKSQLKPKEKKLPKGYIS
jgi:hypothetical protein